jgi:GGDEF domain-containing protein
VFKSPHAVAFQRLIMFAVSDAHFKGKNGITASAGVASLPETALKSQQMIRDADAALYRQNGMGVIEHAFVPNCRILRETLLLWWQAGKQAARCAIAATTMNSILPSCSRDSITSRVTLTYAGPSTSEASS